MLCLAWPVSHGQRKRYMLTGSQGSSPESRHLDWCYIGFRQIGFDHSTDTLPAVQCSLRARAVVFDRGGQGGKLPPGLRAQACVHLWIGCTAGRRQCRLIWILAMSQILHCLRLMSCRLHMCLDDTWTRSTHGRGAPRGTPRLEQRSGPASRTATSSQVQIAGLEQRIRELETPVVAKAMPLSIFKTQES